jgi:hypothetical protein
MEGAIFVPPVYQLLPGKTNVSGENSLSFSERICLSLAIARGQKNTPNTRSRLLLSCKCLRKALALVQFSTEAHALPAVLLVAYAMKRSEFPSKISLYLWNHPMTQACDLGDDRLQTIRFSLFWKRKPGEICAITNP